MDISSSVKSWTVPVILTDVINNWSALKNWSPSYLAQKTNQLMLRFRLGCINCETLQWETDSVYIDATIADFVEWQSKKKSNTPLSNINPFSKYSGKEFWAYADYKYVRDTLKDFPELVEELRWTDLGFPVDSSWKSTFWLGSPHAYTICHYDTYAYNLVAQLCGRKRWILFPPGNRDYMYPSRVPYEESTVFSRVNLLKPDLTETPLFAKATPYVVTLEPGQVLFVPRHWWHFVECQPDELSISVNLWVDQPEFDDSERLGEALTRLVTFSFIDSDSVLSSAVSYLHYKERADLLEENWFSDAIEKVKQNCVLAKKDSSDTTPFSANNKLPKIESSLSELQATPLVPSKLSQIFDLTYYSLKENGEMISDQTNSSADILRALTHPSVVECMKRVLLNE